MELFCCCCGTQRANHQREPPQRPTSGPVQYNETLALEECQIPVPFTFGVNYPRSSPLTVPPDPRSGRSMRPSANNILEKVPISWKSAVPITRRQLERKRTEFWETAPAYGGSMEAWQAIREAVNVGHVDIDTARMILACAGILTPTGVITEAYDERGFKYTIPTYCICDPINGFASEAPNQDHEDSGSIPKDSIENTSFRSLKLRLSIGEDVEIQAPNTGELTIAQIKKILRKQLATDRRIELFWAGHGPLAPSLKYSSLLDSVSAPCTILQAWLL